MATNLHESLFCQNMTKHLECSTLEQENQLLKEKYNMAAVQVSHLEIQLLSSHEKLEDVQDSVGSEIDSALRQSQVNIDKELDCYQQKICSLSRENSEYQTEIRCLQRKLDVVVKELNNIMQVSDCSKLVAAQGKENAALMTEISTLNELFKSSEEHLSTESGRNVSLNLLLAQATEANALLQIQLDSEGCARSVAKKQVSSLEERLQLIAERLASEREDRAGGLSQVEERLLSDKSTLLAAEQELQRQLQREKDKTWKLEQRVNDYRDENTRLRLLLPIEHTNISTIEHSSFLSSTNLFKGCYSKKDNINEILKVLEEEEGFKTDGISGALVWLWNRCIEYQELLHKWNICSSELYTDIGDRNWSAQPLHHKLYDCENKIIEWEERIMDVQAEKVTIVATYKEQLSVLAKERHESFAQRKTLQDLMDAVMKENENLHEGLAAFSNVASSRLDTTDNCQIESLRSDLRALETKTIQQTRENKALVTEVETLRAQVSAREIALGDRDAKEDVTHSAQSSNIDVDSMKTDIAVLSDELSRCQLEMLELQRDKDALQRESKHAGMEVVELERQVSVLISRCKTRKVQQQEQLTKDESLRSKIALMETEMKQKDVQLHALEGKLQLADQGVDDRDRQLSQQSDSSAAVNCQLEECRQQLERTKEEMRADVGNGSLLQGQVASMKNQIEQLEAAFNQKHHEIEEKDCIISKLESELCKGKDTLEHALLENKYLHCNVKSLEDDICNLVNVNASNEEQWTNEKLSVIEERDGILMQYGKISASCHELEDLKHERNYLMDRLSLDGKNSESLQLEIGRLKGTEKQLCEEIDLLTVKTEVQHSQFLSAKEDNVRLTADKERSNADYQQVCRQLTEKEYALNEEERRMEDQSRNAQLGIARILATSTAEKGQMEVENSKYRQEVVELRERLKDRDSQLSRLGHTLAELDTAHRQKEDFESKLKRFEMADEESKILHDSLKRELFSLSELNKQLQDAMDRSQESEAMQHKQLEAVKEAMGLEITALHRAIEGMTAHHDAEKKPWSDSVLRKKEKQTCLEKDLELSEHARLTLEEDRRKLHVKLDAITLDQASKDEALTLTLDKLNTLMGHASDVEKSQLATAEELLTWKTACLTLESDLKKQQEIDENLQCQLKKFSEYLESDRSGLLSKQEQIEFLQVELARQKDATENLKKGFSARLQKSTLALKRQTEAFERERANVSQQTQELASDLERVREQVSLKNIEAIQLQQQISALEQNDKEGVAQLMTAQTTIRCREEFQNKLDHRFQEQQEELRKLFMLLSKKISEQADGKAMWVELNHLIQKLSAQFVRHVDEVKASSCNNQERCVIRIQQLKHDLHSLEGTLSKERALHDITRSALAHMEEDCSRLRSMMHQMQRRRRGDERKEQSHLEEVNGLIAQSKAKAQALVASDATLHPMIPSRDCTR